MKVQRRHFLGLEVNLKTTVWLRDRVLHSHILEETGECHVGLEVNKLIEAL